MRLTVISAPGRAALQREATKILKRCRSENGAALIVPDQSSFSEEERLIAEFGVCGLGNPEVLSFKRLFYKLREDFPSQRLRLSAPAREMAVMHALADIDSEDFRLFRGVVKKRELTSTVSALITGFKCYGVTAERLRAAEEGLEEGSSLKNKIHDCLCSLESYDRLMTESGLCDADDDMWELGRILSLDECRFFEGKTVCIRHFSDLNILQRQCVGQICRRADEVVVAVCADDKPEFATARKLINALERTARDYGAEFAHIRLPRLESAEAPLGFLCASYYGEASPFEGSVGADIRLHISKNPFSEVMHLAASIARLVRKGRRYRDITVVAREPETYAGYIRRIFPLYSIPVFVDGKRPLSQHSVSRLLLSAMELASYGFTNENVFSFAKNPFAPHGGDCGELEDYCIEAGIRSWNWSEDFTFIRGSYSAKEYNKEKAAERLGEINERRRELWELIEPLRLCLKKERTGEEFARGLYEFMLRCSLPEKAEKAALCQEENGDERGAAETRQVYNLLIDILDDICTVFGKSVIEPDELTEAVKTACGAVKIGVVPPLADSVIFGDIERMKGGSDRIVFLLGLNEDVFPRAFSNNSIFTEYEAEALSRDWGIELPPSCAEKADNEKLLVYEAVSSAAEQLYLSCPLGAPDGRNMRPSPIIKRIKELFPSLCETEDVNSPEGEYLAATKAAAYSELGTAISDGGNERFWNVIRSILKSDPEYAPKLAALESAGTLDTSLTQRLEPELLKKVLGDEIALSPSALESFASCPFSYFAQNILRLKSCVPMNINPADSGNLLHNIIDGFCGYVMRGQGGWKSLTDDAAEDIFARVCAEIRLGLSRQITSDPRLKTAVARIERTARKCIEEIRAQINDELFVPTGGEIIIDSQNGHISPAKITLPDGRTARFRGRIDRADVRRGVTVDENGEERTVDLVRIIDYKSSGRDISFTKVLNGLQLQLFAYMDSYLSSDENARPAAALYFNLTETPSETAIGDDEPEKKERLSGVAVAGRMAQSKSIAEIDADEMKTVLRYVRRSIAKTAKEIYEGRLPVSPVLTDGRLHCEYCDYASLCKLGLSPCSRVRPIGADDGKAAIEQMKNELEECGDEA